MCVIDMMMELMQPSNDFKCPGMADKIQSLPWLNLHSMVKQTAEKRFQIQLDDVGVINDAGGHDVKSEITLIEISTQNQDGV